MRIPGARRIVERLRGALVEMLAPLRASEDPDAPQHVARFDALEAEPWFEEEDETLRDARIERAAGASREAGDTLHLLVLDLHKALNRLQADYARDVVDGARTFQLSPPDRELVTAFMRGVNRTRALKLDHPGLETTATRIGDRLVLQNDIGTTDAHVLVVHVEGLAATVTYTDVHLPRLLFFQSLFRRWPVQWNDTLSRSDAAFEGGVYHVAAGRHEAGDRAALNRYLEFLGSRVVFLIDWNRARKRLRRLLGKKDAAALLRWAAEEEIGHMAFLRIGGEQVVFDALASLGKAPSTFGARLDDVLGRDAALEYLRFVFRVAAEALRDGRPENLVRDQIRAELLGSIVSARQTLLDYASEQAGLALEIASVLRDCLIAGRSGVERYAGAARRAKAWERHGDELVNLAREIARRSDNVDALAQLVERGDDMLDALEDAAFHLSLLAPDRLDARVLQELGELAGLAVQGTQEQIKAIECSRDLAHGAPRADVQDFLQAVHRIVTVEQRSDDAERALHGTLVAGGVDARDLFICAEIARGLESATDALAHSALELRDHMLGSVMTA